MTDRWGAQLHEWDMLTALGLGGDLLPIVSNPNAEISPNSSLDRKGKTPSVYNAAGQIIGFKEWSKHHASQAELAAWRDTPDYGIFLNARTLHSFDVDLDDWDMARRVAALLAPFNMPIRYRQGYPRFLAVWRPTEPYKPRRAIRFGDGIGVVEFYGIGKGYVVAGSHPKGGRYAWTEAALADAPTLAPGDVEAIWSAISSLAPEHLKPKTGAEGDSDESWVAAVLAGENLHDALRTLSYRGWSLDALENLMGRSAAKVSRFREWETRRADIPRLVESARLIRAKQAGDVFAAPITLPPGADAALRDPVEWTGKAAVNWEAMVEAVDKADAAARQPTGEGEDAIEFTEDDLRPLIMDSVEMERDLVLVEGSGAVVHIPTMRVRAAARLQQVFAGCNDYFIDKDGSRQSKPSLKIWQASPGRKSVDVVTWWPGMPTICRPPETGEDGNRAINTWRGFDAWPVPDDWADRIGPWHEHLSYLVPDDTERRRFEQWVGHIAQFPGVLPHVCYLMYTETTGIGRNWLSGVLGRVFRGYVADGIDLSKVLDGGFNGRLARKVLATVDEAREGMSGKQYKTREMLKELITKNHREVNPKYGVPSVQANCTRWLFLSNHKDAIPFDAKDRRVIVIKNPTERQPTAYYDRMYAVARDPKFIGSVWHHLLTQVDLSGFNPAAPAPMNAAKADALGSMRGIVEAALHDLVQQWPGDLIDRESLLEWVKEANDGMAPHPYHLNQSMVESGLIPTDKRVRVGGVKTRVVILRNWTKEAVMAASPVDLVQVIVDARARSAFTGNG